MPAEAAKVRARPGPVPGSGPRAVLPRAASAAGIWPTMHCAAPRPAAGPSRRHRLERRIP